MYKREVLTNLRNWSKKKNRKPLVLRGARQVGKTTLINDFGKEFDHYLYLNLELKDNAVLFRNYDSVEALLSFLLLKHHIRKDDVKRTLLFIDEIQEETKAVQMLRYFYEQTPWLYVIAAGSRLQSLVRQHISFPVGRVEYLTLRPFSFAEYLAAVAGDEWVKILDNCAADCTAPDPMVHQELQSHFNRYALIGGMPEVVSTYIDNQDIESLSSLYRSLINSFSEDVERYAKGNSQVAVLRHILQYGWAFAGQSIKFARFAGSEYSSTQMHEAMDILQRAFILSLDYPVTSVNSPAVPSHGFAPKMIMMDAGLVNYMANIQIEYLQNKELLDTWRGYAAEQIVAQELRVVLDRRMESEQYFWVRDKKGASAEVDFIMQHNGRIIPIEVKAGNNAHLRSLHSFVNLSDNDVTAVRIWSGELSVQDITTPAPNNKPFRLINIPFYLVGYIDKIIDTAISAHP